MKFRQASNCCKEALEAIKLTYANKTKGSTSSLPKNFVHVTFGEQLI